MWQKSSSSEKELGSTAKQKHIQKEDIDFDKVDNHHSINAESGLQDNSLGSVNIAKRLERSQRSSFFLVPPKQSFSYLTTAWNFTIMLLLWLSGICVASVLNFPYFVASIYFLLSWALRLNQTRHFIISQRVVVMVAALYSAVHLIVLYLYQFQSAQDLVPRPSVSARYTYLCMKVLLYLIIQGFGFDWVSSHQL